MRSPRWISAVAGCCLAAAAHGACLGDAQVAELAEKFFQRIPAPNPEGLSEPDAACTRAKFHGRLLQRYGAAIGYKAGLTNPAVQQRFGTDRPVWGRLYQGMLLADGATVPATFGARALFEADLLVRVKSADVNRARTPMDVLEAIDQIIPFIELPDLVVEAPPRLNGPAVGAINVGARLGVTGRPMAVPLYRAERYAVLNALRDMQVILSDGGGAVLASGKGSDILGHPLQAVVWLVGALASEGLALQPGQLVSLGSFSPLLPPRPGLKATLRYDGLPGAGTVSVAFE